MNNITNIDALAKGEIQEESKVKLKEVFSVPVIVDNDQELEFETDSWIMKILWLPLRLFLNMLPAKLGGMIFTAFSRPSGDTKTVHRWATTYKAVEVPYTYPIRRAQGKTNFSDDFWENFLLSARGVRNRLKIVKRELTMVIEDICKKRNPVNLVSLGSGSARGVIEVVAQFRNSCLIRFKCIDLSRKAIQFSRDLASKYGVVTLGEWHRDFAHNVRKYCSNPDIIEVVGLFDYYEGEQAVNLLHECYQALDFGGWLIISNAVPNVEVPFFTKGVNWKLIYRTPEQLAELLVQSGFSVKKILLEPLRVHTVIVAQKLA